MRSDEWDTPVSMIGRVAAILRCFSARDAELSIGEISRRTGLAKSTTSRVVSELVEHGFLERKPGGVELGLLMFELGEGASRPRALRRLAYAHLEELRHRTGKTVHLAVLDDAEVVYIEILLARRSPPMPSAVGGRVNAHATAVGKVLLAFADAERRERVIARGLPQVGPATITDPEVLRAHLAEVVAQGFATERSESAAGVACVAMPMRVGDGAPIAAVSVSAAESEMDLPAVQALLAETMTRLSRAAARIPGASAVSLS